MEQSVTDSSFLKDFENEIKWNFLSFKQIRLVQSGLISHRCMRIQYATGVVGKEQSCRGKFVASE